MKETDILPPPDLEAPPKPQGKWEQEYQAFLKLKPQLLKSHRGRYVAIHEGKLVDDGPAEAELARRVYEHYGYVPIYVGLVSGDSVPPIRIPTPRLPLPGGNP